MMYLLRQLWWRIFYGYRGRFQLRRPVQSLTPAGTKDGDLLICGDYYKVVGRDSEWRERPVGN